MTDEKLNRSLKLKQRIENLKRDLDYILDRHCQLKFCRLDHNGQWKQFDFWEYKPSMDMNFTEVRMQMKAEIKTEIKRLEQDFNEL